MKKTYKLLFFAILNLSFLFSSAQGIWTQRANFGGAGRYFPAAFSIGAKGYVGTGCISGVGQNDFWEYNQVTNVWTQKAIYPGHGTYAAVGFSIGTKGYIETRDYFEFYEYDPATNTWTQKAVPPSTKYGGVGFAIGNKGYVGTGDENDSINDFWEYDPANDAWTQKAGYGGGIRSFSVGFSIGPKGYIGTGRNNGNHKDFWEYDPASNVWVQKADFAGGPTCYASGFSIGGKGYIGLDGTTNFWQYNPVNDSWTPIALFPGGAVQTTTGFSIGNKGYITCGQFNGGNELWEFDPQDTAMSLFRGKVNLDSNANCVMDGNDSPLMNWFVQAQNNFLNDIRYASTDLNGNYEMWVPSGTYSMSLISKPYWNQVCPTAPPIYLTSVAPNDTINNLNFGADIGSYCPDLAIGIGAASFRRCMTNNLYVQYWNLGTVTAIHPLLKMDFDQHVIPLSSTIPWDSVSGQSYFWKVDSVQANQFVSFTILDSISCNAQVGDTLFVGAQWMNNPTDCNAQNDGVKYHRVVTASHDPNSKEACTGSNNVFSQQSDIYASDTIHYAIHFQNTGNDTAFNVVVFDTLDSHLNPVSVITGVSSHPYTFELLGSGVLKWTFHNILLPDSTVNEPNSNGYVDFLILQRPGNTIGTVIKNSAAIVFDFNLPVITDTVELTISSPEGVHGLNKVDRMLTVYPNPTNGSFWIVTNSQRTQVEIYDVLGEKVFRSESNEMRTEVDLRNEPKGIYLVRAIIDGRSYVQKIIIQ